MDTALSDSWSLNVGSIEAKSMWYRTETMWSRKCEDKIQDALFGEADKLKQGGILVNATSFVPNP